MGNTGSLALVGVGIMLGAHLTPRARSHIVGADIVFAAVSDPLVTLWLRELNPALVDLAGLYQPGKPRQQTYREMVEAMLAETRRGRRVCGAFYGHPGVFALAPHVALRQARAEGFPAVLEPGISAADCLYADLAIDPGEFGCQHYEATQLLLQGKSIDPGAYLVVWQAAVVGDRTCARFEPAPDQLLRLQQRLQRDYPEDHPVILYEAATSALEAPRIERLPLARLARAELKLQSTLVLPPAA